MRPTGVRGYKAGGGALEGTLQRVSDARRGGCGGAWGGHATWRGRGARYLSALDGMYLFFFCSLWQGSRYTPPSPPAPAWGGSTAAFVVLLEFGAATAWLRLLLGGDVAQTPLPFWQPQEKFFHAPPLLPSFRLGCCVPPPAPPFYRSTSTPQRPLLPSAVLGLRLRLPLHYPVRTFLGVRVCSHIAPWGCAGMSLSEWPVFFFSL